MKLINTTEELKNTCHSLMSEEFLTIDTEFSSEKTYFPKLCLIQISSINQAFAVDCLANIDLSPLFEILFDKKIVKVFHSSRIDLEIIYQIMGKLPSPIFDTQIAASVCGYGDSVGYETLVRKICNINLDKSFRYSNWEQRPLSSKQLSYALSDVINLVEIYQHLSKEIDSNNRRSWIEKEMQDLSNESNYQLNTNHLYKKIKLKTKSPRFIYMVNEIAKWREKLAISKNIPKSHVLKDQVLLEIAAIRPSCMSDILKIRNFPRLDIENTESLIEIINNSDGKIEIEESAYIKNFESISPLINSLLKILASKNNVSEKLLASNDDIKNHILNLSDKLKTGWRYDIFGKHLDMLLDGKLSLSIKDREIILNMI